MYGHIAEINSKKIGFPAGSSPAACSTLESGEKFKKRCKYMRYCGRQKSGKALLLSDDEIISNALEQEKS